MGFGVQIRLTGSPDRRQIPHRYRVPGPADHLVDATGIVLRSHFDIVFQVQSPNTDIAATTAVIRSARVMLMRRHLVTQHEQHPD